MIVREIDTKNPLTKSDLPVSDYSLNPYVGCEHGCKYCYACFMKRFTNHEEPWGEFLDVKFWKPLSHPERYRGKEVFLGSVTDPYQPAEEKYRRTRAVLEELRGSGVKLSIATKSDLILRDLDLIQSFPGARISWSINTLDENFKDDMDRAALIPHRLAVTKAYHEAGVRTTCFISHICPGTSVVPAIIGRVKGDCNLIWLENLNLRGTFKPVILKYIREKRPDLVPLYEDISARKQRLLAGARRGASRICGSERAPLCHQRRFDEPPVRRSARCRQLLLSQRDQTLRTRKAESPMRALCFILNTMRDINARLCVT